MSFTYNVDKQKQLSIVFVKLKPPKARSRRKKPATDARRLCDGGGDVIGVYDTSTGNKLIEYKYNAWGTCTTSYYNSGMNTTATIF